MVDSTKGVGPFQGITSAGRTQSFKNVKQDDEVSRADKTPRDEVVLSKKAMTLAEVEEAARQTREDLQNSDFSLGLNPSFDERV